jgi:hypothetical protein
MRDIDPVYFIADVRIIDAKLFESELRLGAAVDEQFFA